MKRLKVVGGSLEYREDLMIPSFRFPGGHRGLNSLAACRVEVEQLSLLMVLSHGSVISPLGPRDGQKRG
jgi:hypothetical protein